MGSMKSNNIRFATESDLDIIIKYIKELAAYEKMTDNVRLQPELVKQHLFSDKPFAEAIIAELDGVDVGFALFFSTYSTFEGKPGIHLEDLFITPEAGGNGLGKAMLQFLANETVKRGGARFEWTCLDWNQPSIDFYESQGAKCLNDWLIFRMDGKTLQDFASL